MSRDNPSNPESRQVERILRRARRSVLPRDMLVLLVVRMWRVLAAFGGVMFARWYRPIPSMVKKQGELR